MGEAITASDVRGGTSMAETCRSKSRFGRCGLILRHDGDHAVSIGDGVWFVYGVRPGRKAYAIGYCKDEDGTWVAL